MDISDEAYRRSKMILGHMFELNSITDNVAYNMNFHYLNKMGDIYHLSFAHLFPGEFRQASAPDRGGLRPQ